MQTKKEFDKRGIRYQEMQLENHPDMLEQFKLEGLMAAPIIVTDIKKWSGFRLEKIKSLESYLKDEPKKSSLNLDQKFDVAIGLLMDDNLVWDDDFELIRKELAELISSKRGLGASNHPSVLAIIEKLVKEE
jgi:glutaredoxin